jgi:hypothetical protein
VSTILLGSHCRIGAQLARPQNGGLCDAKNQS